MAGGDLAGRGLLQVCGDDPAGLAVDLTGEAERGDGVFKRRGMRRGDHWIVPGLQCVAPSSGSALLPVAAASTSATIPATAAIASARKAASL